jgi:NAD(P)-dependent dehydrogenase (short-subunit alcohol dehydrogenase family)
MSTQQNVDPDMYTKMMSLTSTYHTRINPALQAAQSSAAGKFVLITGASRGLGRVMAHAWAKGGAAGIAICARKAPSLEPVAAELKTINPNVDVLAQACDTTNSAEVANFFAATKAKFGKLDVVIANVGIANAPSEMPKIGDQDPELWWDIMATNVQSTYLTAHHFINAFGPDPNGTFIITTSGAAAIVPPGLSSYGMSKQAGIRLGEFLDVEYPSLRVFSMDPGIVKGIATMEAFLPFAVVEPELIGAFSVWLASGRADGCKGGYLHVAWDIEDLEKHADEIASKGLVKSKFLAGILGQEGGALGR